MKYFIVINIILLKFVTGINCFAMSTFYKRLSMSLLAIFFTVMAVIVSNDVRKNDDPGKRLATFPKETAIVAIP